MTCNWNLGDGQPQLAVAARISTALWTLHESGTPNFDQVIAATVGGPGATAPAALPRDRRHRQVARRRRRGGQDARLLLGRRRVRQPGGVPLGRLVQAEDRRRRDPHRHRRADTALPGAKPALRSPRPPAASRTSPRRRSKAGRPCPSTRRVDPDRGCEHGNVARSGVGRRDPHRDRALAPRARRPHDAGTPHDRISWFSATDGTKLGSVVVSGLRRRATRRERPVRRVPRRGSARAARACANRHIAKLVTTGQNYRRPVTRRRPTRLGREPRGTSAASARSCGR